MKKLFKKSQPVRAKGARGTTSAGRVAGIRDMGPGRGGGIWVDVNVGERGKPRIKSYRPSAVTPA